MLNNTEFFGQYKVKDAEETMVLGVGQPSPNILKDALKFINYNISSDNSEILQYGYKSGFDSFRSLVEKLLIDYTNTNVNTNNIYMTNGVSQAVFMLASLFKNKSYYNTVYVEDLTYFIMINTFKDLGFNIKSFNLKKLDKLQTELKENPKSIVYLIPFCNNPTGRTMLRCELVEFLATLQKETIVFSDETYQFLHYPNSSKEDTISKQPLACYLPNILSLGTFSKILAPGIRLGWIYSTYMFSKDISLNNFLDDTGFMDSGGSVNPVMGFMVTRNLLKNYDEYKIFLNGIISDLQSKSNHVVETLKKYQEHFEVIMPHGGYFVFVKAKKIKSRELVKLASESFQLSFHEGNKFSIDKVHDNWFRLSVSYYSLENFKEYFGERIDNLVSHIDIYKYDVSLYGNGKLGKLIKNELYIYNQLDRSLNLNDFGKIIIDVTSPEGTIELIDKCLLFKKYPKLIIGTTGHTEDQIQIIKNYSKYASVIYCSNFSNGIQNLIKMIKNLTFDITKIEIKDIHHIHKKDAPSGTAKLLLNELQKIYPDKSIDICSVREGEVVGYHEIKLYGDKESITLIHNAEDRSIFAKGCVGMIEKIKNKENGYYDSL
jgi:4-hydroxy-tetrahydrodipicolinate reductase